MTRLETSLIAAACCLMTNLAQAQLTVTITDISPDRSTISHADGAAGGRLHRVGTAASIPTRVFAASEWGGIFRSNDGGVNWAHLDRHVPTVTTDVKVDPTNANRVYATSLYDGRATSRSGINVSTDGG